MGYRLSRRLGSPAAVVLLLLGAAAGLAPPATARAQEGGEQIIGEPPSIGCCWGNWREAAGSAALDSFAPAAVFAVPSGGAPGAEALLPGMATLPRGGWLRGRRAG